MQASDSRCPERQRHRRPPVRLGWGCLGVYRVGAFCYLGLQVHGTPLVVVGKADGDAVGIGLVIQAVKHVSIAVKQTGVARAVSEALLVFAFGQG